MFSEFVLLAMHLVLVDVSGVVTDEMGSPLEGVEVRLQTSLDPPVLTNSSGQFVLPCSGVGLITLGFALPYDRNAPQQFVTRTVNTTCGSSGLSIMLEPYPTGTSTTYEPIKAASPNGCGDCHSLQYDEWAMSRHAGAATNFWVQDLYTDFRASHDGSDTGSCATCHAPAAEAHNPGSTFLDDVNLSTSALEGVNCSSCHQIDGIDPKNMQALHLQGNASMRFPCSGPPCTETHEYVWGPIPDVGYAFMKAGYQPQFTQSLFCGSCHEYTRPGTSVPGQTTYSEWLGSEYANPSSTNFRTCQDCHMPAASDPGRLCDPPIGFGNGPIRPGAAHRSHQIEGTTPARLEEAVTLNGLLSISENRLFVEASVQNVAAGHAFPTGISLRNVILRVLAQADNGELTLLEGPLIPELGSDRNGVPEEGDWAGQPGFLFGKVLAGRINGVGEEVSPVLFVDAERVAYQQVIQPFETHVSQYQFDLSGGACQTGQIDVTLQLVYRRAWRFLAVEKGWTTDALGEPWEQVIASWQDSLMVPPIVQIVADPDPACPDGTTLTAVPACLQGPFTYSWSGPNIIGPSDSPSIVVQPTASSTYSLTVSGMNGMAQSQFSLGVLPAFSWPQLLSEWALVPSQPAWDLNANGHLDILDLMPFQTCPP